MRNLSAGWWIAGGWAIELFVGRPLRDHSDLEIGCFRTDVERVIAQFPGWVLMAAREKVLEPFSSQCLTDPTMFSIWCRPSRWDHWAIEILLEDRDGQEWAYRRDGRVRRSVEDIVLHNQSGIPFLCPEIQLLYKSKSPRPKDYFDFGEAWPMLGMCAKDWLANALRIASPSCAWNLKQC